MAQGYLNKRTGGTGDVTGPGSSIDTAIPVFSGTTGKAIVDSSIPTSSGQIGSRGSSRLLGKLTGANLNSTADQAITLLLMSSPKYIIRKVIATNASTTLAVSVAAGGVYTATSKGGSTIVAAGQLYTALTGATKFVDATIALSADTVTVATLYFSLTVAHGSAATADIYIYGDVLE